VKSLAAVLDRRKDSITSERSPLKRVSAYSRQEVRERMMS